MAEDFEKVLEDQIKARLREKGIHHFGPFLKHYSREGDQPRYPSAPHYHNRWAKPHQVPHGDRPGKRSLITALRALARANPSLDVPSWISLRGRSNSEVRRVFAQYFGELNEDKINIVMGGKGAQVNWTIDKFPLAQLVRNSGKSYKTSTGGNQQTAKPERTQRANPKATPTRTRPARESARAENAAASEGTNRGDTAQGNETKTTTEEAKARIRELKNEFGAAVVGDLLRSMQKAMAENPSATNRRQILAEALTEMTPANRKAFQDKLSSLDSGARRSLVNRILVSILDIKLLLRLL